MASKRAPKDHYADDEVFVLPPRIILATTDFSDASRPPLIAAGALARASGATLHVLHAEDPLLTAAARREGLDVTHETRDELQTFVASLLPADVRPTLHVVTGSAADQILEVGRRLTADLIVVGSHGRTGVRRAIFGSVAEGVLRHADRPILVVPSPSG